MSEEDRVTYDETTGEWSWRPPRRRVGDLVVVVIPSEHVVAPPGWRAVACANGATAFARELDGTEAGVTFTRTPEERERLRGERGGEVELVSSSAWQDAASTFGELPGSDVKTLEDLVG